MPDLSLARLGAWIITISKHARCFDAGTYSLGQIEDLTFAGQCGGLLVALAAEGQETTIGREKLVAHARYCGIPKHFVEQHLIALKGCGCIDWDAGRQTYQVLAFSRRRVLEATSKIFHSLSSSELQSAVPPLMDSCLLRPRTRSELVGLLVQRIDEQQAQETLTVVQNLGLLSVIEAEQIHGGGEAIYYNAYLFADRAPDLASALSSLKPEEREQLDTLLEHVRERPGVPLDDVRVTQRILGIAIGLGLLDESIVSSQAGVARFLSTPLFAVPSTAEGASCLENDAFHHAKMLLASLRFGELRSGSSRGRISDPPVLLKALLERDRIGPCTAIGQDYVLLEAEGVIQTMPATERPGRQFYMALRRREPAEILYRLLQEGEAAGGVIHATELGLASGYSGPNLTRPGVTRKLFQEDPETVQRFMEAIRT